MEFGLAADRLVELQVQWSVPMDVLELLWGRGLCVVWCGAEFGFLGMSDFFPLFLYSLLRLSRCAKSLFCSGLRANVLLRYEGFFLHWCLASCWCLVGDGVVACPQLSFRAS